MAKDQYSQIAYIKVEESVANTLAFAGMSVFSNVLGQKGMLIHRVDYQIPEADINILTGAADAISVGIAGDDSLAAASLDNPEVYDFRRIQRLESGTPANFIVLETGIYSDFNALPGGGMLVPADRLFGFVKGSNLGATVAVNIRVRFTLLDMTPSDYLELAQSMRVLR